MYLWSDIRILQHFLIDPLALSAVTKTELPAHFLVPVSLPEHVSAATVFVMYRRRRILLVTESMATRHSTTNKYSYRERTTGSEGLIDSISARHRHLLGGFAVNFQHPSLLLLPLRFFLLRIKIVHNQRATSCSCPQPRSALALAQHHSLGAKACE